MSSRKKPDGWSSVRITDVLLLCAMILAQTPVPLQADLLRIAHQAVDCEVTHKKQPAVSGSTPPKPVFVTIELNGKVLGCRGDLSVRTTTLEREIQTAARSAAAHDPRYSPLKSGQLAKALITITIVDSMESMPDVRELRPEDGLVLESGGKKGIVLPWEGKDARVRLQWAYKKAGVPKGSSVRLYRLIAERFRG